MIHKREWWQWALLAIQSVWVFCGLGLAMAIYFVSGVFFRTSWQWGAFYLLLAGYLTWRVIDAGFETYEDWKRNDP